jgi:diguanylate cyclase (GGDEF)-like protein
MAALLGVLAVSIVHEQAASRTALLERFQSRAELTASFVTGYVSDLAAREETQAGRLLTGPAVSDHDLEQMVLGLDFDVAAVFDAQGRLLAIWPHGPELLGEPFTDRYPHVAAALSGHTGVSGVSASATTSSPVVAIAVPYETPSGRRVFSGAVRPDTGSLRIYFDTIIPLSGRTYLLDEMGNIVVAGKSGDPADLPPMLTAGGLLRLDEPEGTFESEAGSFVYVRQAVAGTPWHVILTTPGASLYKPIERAPRDSWLLFAALAVTGVVGLVLFSRLSRAHAVAAATARLDALTWLPNRRAAEEHLERTAAAAARQSHQFGVLMIDIDRFKSINDAHGHTTGDLALCLVAQTLRSTARGEDVVCRWGGEEFMVVLAATSESELAVAGERFRAAIAAAILRLDVQVELTMTISVGGAIGLGRGLDATLEAADAALYAAKLTGRDRVVINHAESGLLEALVDLERRENVRQTTAPG